MSIKHWPESERPREKLLKYGVASISDAELLAVFLQTGLPGESAVDRARQVLSRFGNLGSLLNADRKTFCDTPGLGPARYALLQAAQELCRRHVFCEIREADALTSPALVREYLALQLSGLQQEIFAGLFLDNRHRVLEYQQLSVGTIDSAAVYPREVVKRCLATNAAAVIFAHNHPSGVAEPSDTDVRLTRKLIDALALIDVRVLDHMIIGHGVQTSLAERGLM